MDANELAARFNACLANPENLKKKEEALRFSVGDRVECRLCDHWHSGTVVALLYRDGNMPPGKVAPYQIQLDDDDDEDGEPHLIWAPADDERCIRACFEAVDDGDRTKIEQTQALIDQLMNSPEHSHTHG
uniref:Tudor domain-containing protein n=1 Tax=Haptolina ericina TaxID=156174 RepID=A0A7S3BD29_9EUKA